jgi:hypothetical protein
MKNVVGFAKIFVAYKAEEDALLSKARRTMQHGAKKTAKVQRFLLVVSII